MIGYLAAKYFGNVLVLTATLALFSSLARIPMHDAVPRALFWSGLIAAVVTYRTFKRRNLWPLYDNLRLPKYVLLGLFVAFNTAVSLCLNVWLT